MTTPKTTVHYAWREFKTPYGEVEPRLLIPWGDPQEYEFAFDFIFDTPEEARECKASDGFGPSSEEDWVLVKVTIEVVE